MQRDVEVEVNLRIPRVKVPSLDERGYPIDHGSVRFTKRVIVPTLPKPGDSLQLTARSGKTLGCDVLRSDWSDEKGLFIVFCKYSKRSIPTDEHSALMDDAEWKMRPLL